MKSHPVQVHFTLRRIGASNRNVGKISLSRSGCLSREHLSSLHVCRSNQETRSIHYSSAMYVICTHQVATLKLQNNMPLSAYMYQHLPIGPRNGKERLASSKTTPQSITTPSSYVQPHSQALQSFKARLDTRTIANVTYWAAAMHGTC